MGKKENNNSEPEKSAENGTRDIFAGAFDDIPIQEIPIESESKPEPENYSDKIDPDNFFSPPSMADIPDIGKLAENNQNYAEKIDSKKSDKISENTDFEFPSFRTPSDIQEIEGVKTSVNLPWEDEDKYDEMDHLPEKIFHKSLILSRLMMINYLNFLKTLPQLILNCIKTLTWSKEKM